MKNIYCILLLLLFASISFAEETLFSDEFESGGFGGPVVKFTTIKNESSVLFGGRGGWIINHQFIIGGGGYGVLNSFDIPEYTINGGPAEMHFGYGGLELEYIGTPSRLTHYSLYCLIGGGVVEYSENDGDKWSDTGEHKSSVLDEVMVIEPAVNATLNVATFFRISVGISYRHVTGTRILGTYNNDLSGLSYNLTFRFGNF